MARRRYVWDPTAVDPRDGSIGCMVEVDTSYQQPARIHYVIPDTGDHISPATGLVVSGRRQRRNDLRASGCRPYEGKEQELKEAARHQAYDEQKLDRGLHEKAERAFAQLSPEKRRALGD